jgi:hypothetical protein
MGSRILALTRDADFGGVPRVFARLSWAFWPHVVGGARCATREAARQGGPCSLGYEKGRLVRAACGLGYWSLTESVQRR